MGGGFWQSPEVQGGGIPFVVALLLVVAVRVVGGREAGGRFAVAAVPAVFLVAYALLEPVSWPPVASKQKVFYIAALALAAGVGAALLKAGRAPTLAITAAFAVIALGWLAIRTLSAGPAFGDLATLVILILASVFLVWRLLAAETEPTGTAEPDGIEDRRRWIHAPAVLLVLSFAAGLISLAGAFIGMAQLAIGLGAILGGYLLVSYVGFVRSDEPLRFGVIGAIGAGGAWLTCVYVMVLFAGAVSRPALAILILAVLADPIARKVRIANGRQARIVQPILHGAIVAVPAVAAVVYAFAMADSEPGY